MKTVLSYKTETTGFIKHQARSSDEGQPHLVRLAVILFNADTQEIIDQMDAVICPEGWDIPQGSIDIHGITTEVAVKNGICESKAVGQFLNLLGKADQVVSSSKQFNSRIMRIALTRYSTKDVVEEWKNFDSYCVMKLAKDDTGNKKLTLPEALEYYVGQQAINNHNHNSLIDAESAARVFFSINSKS